jgi:hypothetical protein
MSTAMTRRHRELPAPPLVAPAAQPERHVERVEATPGVVNYFTHVGPRIANHAEQDGKALTTVDRSMTLTSAATYFHMVVGQGCGSTVVSPPENGEGLEIKNPPDADGFWRKGLLVR